MEAHSLSPQRNGPAVLRSRRLLAAFSDDRLVEQLRRGNEAAFEVLYDRHHGAVLSYCRHMLGSLHEAEDALQQAFISAHNGIVGSDKPIQFKAWLYTIARNRCLTMLRARRARPSDEIETVSTAGLSDEVQERAEIRQLLGDMRDLPEEQRAALVLSELGDLSHAEVAEVIGCEAPKVKSLVFQARSGLIERRQARETPCEEIREQLSTLTGGSLRRGPLRRHLKECPGCSEFRAEVKRQRQMLAIALPVIPTLGLKESALAAAGTGAASSAGGTGVTAAGGAAAAAKLGVAKVAVIAIATGGAAVGGGVAVERTLLDSGGSTPATVQPSPAAERSAGSAHAEGRAGAPGADGARGKSEDAPGRVKKDSGEQNARELAADRGKGRHLGNAKTPPGQARAKEAPGQAKAPGKPEAPGANGQAQANGKATPKTNQGQGQATIPPGQTTAPGQQTERAKPTPPGQLTERVKPSPEPKTIPAPRGPKLP